jgi:transposase
MSRGRCGGLLHVPKYAVWRTARKSYGEIKETRLNKGIRGFDWLPSSPDLNPIEKVWRWIKHEISKLETVPTTIEDMKEVLQELWNEVDLRNSDI